MHPNGYRITDLPRRASRYYSQRTDKIPSGMPKREAKIKFRVVFFGLVGMVIVYSIIYFWVFVVEPTVTNVDNQWHTGDQRISTTSGNVHAGGKTVFISFQDENKQIVVITCEKGKYTVYIG